jgi:DNA-binding CsgD family transcriptional regulator
LELLRQRAAAVGAAIQEADLPHAVELCQRLDGIPLAIELAAGRLMTLSVAEVLERLDDRFRLLTGGARHGPVAHQTVRQVMDWSYQLCTAHGKLLWQRVSVFSGGFDLTAAEQVCGGDNIPVEDVLDVLAGLVRQSVLVVERDGSTIRYRLLETLRQYGSQMLAQANQEQSYRARHRDYYQHMAAHAAQDWFSEREPRWIRRVRGEMANFRAAIMYSSTEDAVGTAGLETAVNIARLPIWLFDGWPAEGRGWLERTLDSAPGCGDSLRVTALAFIGWFAVLQGDIASAGKLLVDCRQATAGGQAIVPTAAFFEGVYAFLVDGNPNSVALLAQAHRVSAEAGEPKATVAQAEMMWSLAASFLCDPETGRAAAEQHLENATHHGGPIWAATAKFAVAVPLTRQGNPRRAVNLLREALRVQREMDDRWGIMWSTDALVWALAALVRSSPATDGRYDADSARTVARLLGGARQMRKWLGLSGAGVFESEHAVAEHVVRDILGESTYLAELRNGSFPEERENDGMRRIISLAMGERMPSEPSEPHILTKNSDLPKLTNREMEITALIAKGLSNPEIARKLVISDRTVQTHVTNILNKRGLRNRHQLAVWYAGDNQN